MSSFSTRFHPTFYFTCVFVLIDCAKNTLTSNNLLHKYFQNKLERLNIFLSFSETMGLLLRSVMLSSVLTTIANSADLKDGNELLDCNWASRFSNFELLVKNVEMQEEVMLLASRWEGRFATNNLGTEQESGFALYEAFINHDTGAAVNSHASDFEFK